MALVDSLLDDFDVVDLLTQLTEDCAKLLDVTSAGLLLADPQRKLHLMAATSDRVRDLELFQLQREEGPCLDCFATGQPVSVADLRLERQRWTGFVRAATAAGFRSVHALPMRAGGIVLGTLGLFGTGVGTLNTSDLTVGQALAHVASVAIMQEHGPTPELLLPRLQSALTSRVVVDQAKGLIRSRLDLSIDDAFGLLRRYAHARGAHVTDVARRLVSDRATRDLIVRDISTLAREPES